MAEYVSRPRALWIGDDWHPDPVPQQITVYEGEERPTGLLDINGNPLYRRRDPIGFRPDKE